MLVGTIKLSLHNLYIPSLYSKIFYIFYCLNSVENRVARFTLYMLRNDMKENVIRIDNNKRGSAVHLYDGRPNEATVAHLSLEMLSSTKHTGSVQLFFNNGKISQSMKRLMAFESFRKDLISILVI